MEDLAFATMFETGKLTPLDLKPIHIASMLNEVLEAAYTTDERGNVKDLLKLSIRCSNKVPPVVCADSSLQRILYNLVSNAMQFCSEKGEVTLAVHYSLPPPAYDSVPPGMTCKYFTSCSTCSTFILFRNFFFESLYPPVVKLLLRFHFFKFFFYGLYNIFLFPSLKNYCMYYEYFRIR